MREQKIKKTLKEKLINKTLNDKFNHLPYKISTELEIDNLEKDIPIMAKEIFKKAYTNSVAHGNSVITVIDNTIYEICTNGDRKKIKEIEPLIKLNMSKKIILE